MNGSANTLFHFTSDLNSLISILTNGFYVRYSLENYEALIDLKEAEIAFPMTSFCDIPLARVQKHTKTYGSYALGLTKEWGMKNGISPVIYSYPGSATASILNEVIHDVDSFFDVTPNEMRKLKEALKRMDVESETLEKLIKNKQTITQVNERVMDFIRYIKPYQGKSFRGDEYLPELIKFYDEKEWRFTLRRDFFNGKDLKDSYNPEYYKDPIKRRAINIKLAEFVKLKFKPSDISFIIVEDDFEIPVILKKLELIFENKATQRDLKILLTRLISLNHIRDNF